MLNLEIPWTIKSADETVGAELSWEVWLTTSVLSIAVLSKKFPCFFMENKPGFRHDGNIPFLNLEIFHYARGCRKATGNLTISQVSRNAQY